MNSFNTGDIILVPFSFTNQETNKKRPAVIISSLDYNIERPGLIIMAVTSQINSYHWESYDSELARCGITQPSVIKPVITTIEKNLVIQLMGQLQKNDLISLQGSLSIILTKK